MARRVSRRKNVRRKFVSRGRRMQSQATMPLYYRRKSAIALSSRLRGAMSRGFKRRAQPMSTTTVKRRRQSAPVRAVTSLSKSNRMVYMQKYKLSRVVHATVNHSVERFQNISNYDTDVGAIWVANSANPQPSIVVMPMILLDCGSVQQDPLGGIIPPAAYQCQWSSGDNTASINLAPISGQTSNGAGLSFGFEKENNNDPLQLQTNSNPCCVLDWISLRCNLYGQRNRTTKFVITVFSVTQDEVDPVTASAGHLDKKALFQYLERPFIYSNLQQDNKKKRTGIKVIKEFTYNVDPVTTIDLNTTTGNIHEANIYVKVNKKLEYSYVKNDSQMIGHLHEQGANWTVTDGTASIHNAPKPKQNVYVAIRAFAPKRTTFDGRTAGDSPSIDLICRRGMTYPV